MAAPVKSIEKLQVTVATSATAGTATVLGSQTLANCVPFFTSYVTDDNGDNIDEYALMADFLTGPNRVQLSRETGGSSSALAAEVTLVEFNSSVTNVYSGTANMAATDDEEVVISPFGSPVVLANTWLYFTHKGDDGGFPWERICIRGRITDTNELTFDRATGSLQEGAAEIEWYVVETTDSAWTVDHIDISITDAQTSNTNTSFGTVTMAKTFILGSHRVDDNHTSGASLEAGICYAELTNGTTVTAIRGYADGQIDWSGCVVELAGNENVYRGTLNHDNTDSPETTAAFTAVALADSMVHVAGQNGSMGGGEWTDNYQSGEGPCNWTRWTFASTTTAQSNYNPLGDSDGNVGWEVIEWEVDAGGGAVRRIMVVS